jgi:hypothetical protein
MDFVTARAPRISLSLPWFYVGKIGSALICAGACLPSRHILMNRLVVQHLPGLLKIARVLA